MIYIKDIVKHKYASVIDRATKKIVAAGRIQRQDTDTSGTPPYPITRIGFDGLYRFSTAKNEKFVLHLHEEPCEFVAAQIPADYIMEDLRSRKNPNAHVYVGWTEEDIDWDIKEYIIAIDAIGLRTIASCSGHDVEPLHIDFMFYTVEHIRRFCAIIQEIPELKLGLSTSIYAMVEPHMVPLRIQTKVVGKPAYEAVEKLITVLKAKTP